ncbi:MAG: hypothetical protein IJN24_04655 [Bacteroidaceae bacterium]|nr:hypothetical protein [Bacteroidaceae bacterium]MBQ6694146.1 hypothetical protein [Bacteroidaceae bacterium]MBR7166669.1 hypothetical protein [Bacteroidaceae bacterium]
MRHLIITIIALMYAAGIQAQEGLDIAPLFKGDSKWAKKFSATHIKGKSLKPYNLTLFRSITTSDYRLYEEIEKAVEKDGTKSIDKECGYINDKLYYGFFVFEPKENKYRYLFYRNSSLRSNEPDEVTLVYMEGYATMEELKKMFK